MSTAPEREARSVGPSADPQRDQFDAAADAGRVITEVMLPTQPSVCPGAQAGTSAGCRTALRTTPYLRVIE